MTRLAYWLIFIGLLMMALGCSGNPQPPMPQPNTEPPAKDAPKFDKPAQPVYSPSYINGYNDGYAGTWLAPARWLIVDDYRAGRNAGVRDRQQGLPHRFEKK